jgi:hypothetical protein
MPAPIIAMSHSEGKCSDERYESTGCNSERQYESVEFGTGRPPFVCSFVGPGCSFRPNKDQKRFMISFQLSNDEN